DDVVLVLDRLVFLVGVVVLAGEFEGDEDVFVNLAVVAVEPLAAHPGDRQRMNFAEEDTARIELVAAELGHQPAARAVIEAPADQLFHALVAELANLALQRLWVFGLDFRSPAVT